MNYAIIATALAAAANWTIRVGDMRSTNEVVTAAALDGLVTAPAATNIARAVQNTVYDRALGVAWTAYMHNGSLYYIATTNAPAEAAAAVEVGE